MRNYDEEQNKLLCLKVEDDSLCELYALDEDECIGGFMVVGVTGARKFNVKKIYSTSLYRGTPQPKTWNVLQTNCFILKDRYTGDSRGGLSIRLDVGDVQDIPLEDIDFLSGARYYLMNDNELACITENDGGKIYLLERITT